MPKVSIIIPAFNSIATVERCLTSIRKQSYSDYEVICVDDGSSDGTSELLANLCAADNRFTYVAQNHNGAAEARNAGLDLAQGEFATFVDADDVLPQHALRYMHQITVVHDCDTVIGMYERVDGVTAYTNARSAHLVNKARQVKPSDFDIIHTWTLCNKWFSMRIINEQSLRLESFRHLEDATFLYRYLKFANRIFTCPHIVYTYIKPLPSIGRTTTQSVDEALLDGAEAAFARLQGITAPYGDEFRTELVYRYMNSPLIGDYYRRLWMLGPECANRLHTIARALLAGLDEGHRTKIENNNRDIFDEHQLLSRTALTQAPQITIAIGESVSDYIVPILITGLYDQSFVPFHVIASDNTARLIPDHLKSMPNLTIVGGDAFSQAVCTTAPYVAFIDTDMIYDHRSLKTMFNRLNRDASLNYVAILPKTLFDYKAKPYASLQRDYNLGDLSHDRFLANKLFRSDYVHGKSLMGGLLSEDAKFECITKPAMISFLPEDRFDREYVELKRREEMERARQQKRNANPLRRAKRKLMKFARSIKVPTDTTHAKPKGRDIISFYLDEDVNPTVIMLEGLGKRPVGNMLYLLRVLQGSEYSGYSIYFSVTDESLMEAEQIIRREGFSNVALVVAGSSDYKKTLFTAGYLFNEVDFPNWWIKKPRQTYVNIWHGTPLKALGKAKRGFVHNDANASRNFTMADYLLFPNYYTRHHMLHDCEVDGLTQATALMLGYPRTGILLDNKARKNVRKTMRLDGLQTIAWMPTYRDWLTVERIAETLSAFDRLLQSNQIMFVNLHHKTGGEICSDSYEHIRVFPQSIDTYELLSAIDVLVTDYSSVLFDFASTGRSIVLYCPDLEDYKLSRGMNMDVRDLPFPVFGSEEELPQALARATDSYDAFQIEFNSFDQSDNAKRLCDYVILGITNNVHAEKLEYGHQGYTMIVSDGIKPGDATDLLNSLELLGWPDNTYLSFLEQDVDTDPDAAYPLVRKVPLFATKGKPLSERTEQQRLYGDLPLRQCIVVDTNSLDRIKVFARFDVPVHLFIGDSIAAHIMQGDAQTLRAMNLFARWGSGIYALSQVVAETIRPYLSTDVIVVDSAEQFLQVFFDDM